MDTMFTNHRERFQQNKHNVDPNKPPPEYDDCLSVLDFRARRRKDKSRAPGMMKSLTHSLPIQTPEKKVDAHSNMMFQFPIHGASPPKNASFPTGIPPPPVQFMPPTMQPAPRSPTVRDLEVQRCARILFDAAATAWEDDSDTSDDEDTAAIVTKQEPLMKQSQSEPTHTSFSPWQAHHMLDNSELATSPTESEPPQLRSDRKRLSEELPEEVETVIKRPRPNGDSGLAPDGRSDHSNPPYSSQDKSVQEQDIDPAGESLIYPPRKGGMIIKFHSKDIKASKKVPKRGPTKASSQAPDLSLTGRPPRNGTRIILNNQPTTKLKSIHLLSEPMSTSSSAMSTPSPTPGAMMGSFTPVNGKSAPVHGSEPISSGSFHPINGKPGSGASSPYISGDSSTSLYGTANGTNGSVVNSFFPVDLSSKLNLAPQSTYPPRNGTKVTFARPNKGMKKNA